MKRVKIIIRPKIKLRKSTEFSAEEELVQQFKNITKTECPCCGKTMTLEKMFGAVKTALIVFLSRICCRAIPSGFAMNVDAF